MKKLVVLEVSQKQNYIFCTDRLAENIGASMIIREITEEIPLEFLPDKKALLFAGGGKSVFEFTLKEGEDPAKKFCYDVSSCVLRDYPGVELFMASVEYDESKDRIIDKIDELYAKLESKKSRRKEYFQLYGLGITKMCADTHMPAAVKNREDVPGSGLLSAECDRKIREARENLLLKKDGTICILEDGEEGSPVRGCFKERYMAAFEHIRPEEINGRNVLRGQDIFFEEFLPDSNHCRFANQFEELGGTPNVKSYMAVIVIDGNKMGWRIKDFCENFAKQYETQPDQLQQINLEYKKGFAAMSRILDVRYRSAVKTAIRKVYDNLENIISEEIVSSREDTRQVLPLRPLIISGDDICLVCDARISIPFTEWILEEIESPSEKLNTDRWESGLKEETRSLISRLTGNMHACAGIAMVKSHYPFFRAHELAEELCSNAKAVLPAKGSQGEDGDESVMDFHIVQGEIEGSLREIRRNKYNYGSNTLTCKPFYLHGNSPSGRENEKIRLNSMPEFKERFKFFEDIKRGRGVLKEYREALTGGESKVKEFLKQKKLESNKYKFKPEVDFDVIEMLDIYHSIEKKGDQAG